MKASIFVLFYSITINCFSQVNFFQTNARWGYSTVETIEFPGAGHGEWLHQYEIVSDTVITGMNYKILNDHVKNTLYPPFNGSPTLSYSNSTSYIRYDSLTQKAFMYDIPEILLFDFTLSIGDTIPNTDQMATFPFVIDSIENINFFGNQLKKIYYSFDTYFNASNYIIEGMGSSNGLTSIQPNYISLSSRIISDIICFQLNNDIYPSGSACDVFANITENEQSNSPFLLPAMIRNSFKIALSNSKEGLLEIFDLTGRKIYSKIISDDEVISDPGFKGILNARLLIDGSVLICRVVCQ